MGGVFGQLCDRGNNWEGGIPKSPKFQIRRVDENMWLLVTPTGWAWYYFDFAGCIKWLDYSIKRLMEKRKAK